MKKDKRKLTVHATSGYQYKDTPTIQIKGNYLSEFGFPIGTKLSVSFDTDTITIQKIKNEESNDN